MPSEDRKFDLDALLGDPLTIVLGGKEYTISDIPVEFAIKVSQLGETATIEESLRTLLEVLTPLGIEPEAVQKLDARKAMAAAAIIVASFTSFPDALLRRVPGLGAAAAPLRQRLPGTMPSPPTSAVVEDAAVPKTS